MTSTFKKIIEKPILVLIAVNVLIGLFIFRDFGLAWDEPLFYSYGDALGYAYSPKEWLSGDFNLRNSYGASADDHKNRGPAYLFLARNFVFGLEALGSDSASAWHLVNFLFFQLGVYFLYRISKRWMSEPAAFFTALFFSTQPLLWGHAFINPKDPPFMTFFLASVCMGFEMVDAIAQNAKGRTKNILIASFLLGIATSIRVLGPYAGLLVFIYFLAKRGTIRDKSAWRSFVLYGFVAVVVMFVTWPYLWENPLRNFFEVFRFMSDNPTQLGLLFEGEVYRANNLPRRYFPFMLATTLTEPALPLFIVGLAAGWWRPAKDRAESNETRRDRIVSLSLLLLWFLVLIAYVLIRRPSMYDGIRHFLFILPPIFVFIGLAFDLAVRSVNSLTRSFFRWMKSTWAIPSSWLYAGAMLILILSGVFWIVKLHPYEYTYYNLYIGGTNTAFRTYETDYWLTCYKDAVEALDERTTAPIELFVKRESYIAARYANENIQVIELRGAGDEIQSGDYVLVNSRLNDDLNTFAGAPAVIEIGRVGATFCTIRQIP